jgi:biopolymer transport protein ExbB
VAIGVGAYLVSFLLPTAFLFSSVGGVHGQKSAARIIDNRPKEEPMTVLKLLADAFHEGGWGMWPILTLLMITVSIITERAVVLRKAVIDKEKLLQLLRSQISQGNIQGAIKVCSGNPTPMTRIVQVGLMRANRSEEEIVGAMEEASLRELPSVEKRTGYLAMLGNLATLAGLLGTITGLIKSFAGVAGVDPSQKATLLSKGISEAMNCTAFGLGTGIIGLAAFAWLNGKTQGILDDVAEMKKNVVNLVASAKAAKHG